MHVLKLVKTFRDIDNNTAMFIGNNLDQNTET